VNECKSTSAYNKNLTALQVFLFQTAFSTSFSLPAPSNGLFSLNLPLRRAVVLSRKNHTAAFIGAAQEQTRTVRTTSEFLPLREGKPLEGGRDD
jgi:hypothetical protein